MTFNPGVCPEGRTVAEITLYLYDRTTRAGGFYQGSCCPTGMSFGTQSEKRCVSDITKPLRVFDLMTRAPYSGNTDWITDYEFVTSSFVSSGFGEDGSSTITASNITTILWGTAIADPIVVGWQVEHMSNFPSAYASSLAEKIGVALAVSSAAPTSSSSVPRQADTPLPTPPQSPHNRLSIGAQAGIGAGVALGSIMLGAMVLFILRRKSALAAPTPETSGVAEMEDHDHMLASKKWYLFGKWRNEHDGEERRHELDSRSVNVIPGPPVELPANELWQHNDPH
ncbi:hypothetical protein K505DRAFT_366510 [Melanomma pulvis-pyrius CBS 109.77]|uniref:Uncharacterized protein n=1 Tax=Melanomma pulvis-pyrius CBS 109.77 TaxID=1314802 RepID=A0A6A6WWW9_9PLEO|nr:hypothetical protein K505DRAFT_366510 [Melanomma pulvis-pyrius CBS 109.77]